MSSVVPSESVSTTAACYVSGASAGASTSQEMIPGDPTEFARLFQEQFPTTPFRSALAVIRLAADNATVPFIARYRPFHLIRYC
jgi:hypothetical protein